MWPQSSDYPPRGPPSSASSQRSAGDTKDYTPSSLLWDSPPKLESPSECAGVRSSRRHPRTQSNRPRPEEPNLSIDCGACRWSLARARNATGPWDELGTRSSPRPDHRSCLPRSRDPAVEFAHPYTCGTNSRPNGDCEWVYRPRSCLLLGAFANIVSTNGATRTCAKPLKNTVTMLVVLAIAKLNAVGVDRFLADGTSLRRIRHRSCNQRMLNLRTCGSHRNRILPIYGNLKCHLNGRLSGLRGHRKRLKEFLHRLTHGDLIITHSNSILTIGMPKEHTKKGLITTGKLAEGLDLLHYLGCVRCS